ncbi:HNH endonuclease signature motif containing protein [Mycobacteroides abscessus]|uniref:HNH endonuclease signature motif containing protein n=2 Tax=Mycobacteroides abscessus TaxID=36809 RepID=UPI002E8E3038|nr:HNH endonuclease signature motif containing protein [Mycobacteroides abscessus]
MDRRIPRVTARPVPWTASFGVVMRRFPGCSQPAESADLDHSIPYAIGGHTSADNLKALCRKHHLLETCCGWREVQEPDGIIVWKAPTDTFTTPACALLFANLTRSRTRAQDRKQRRRTERNCNRRTRLQCEDARLAYAEANPPPF